MKLEKICHISSGGTPSRGKSYFYGGDIPWVKISDIENSVNGILTKTEEKITEEGLKSIGNRIFPKGTLLFAMYGSIGKVAITGRELATNQAILGIRPKGNKEIYLPYLKVWFESNKQRLINQGRGVALKNLSATIIRNLEVPLPSFSDQLQIANILSKAENLITQRKQSIALLDEFFKSTFLEMFGDPVRNEKGWKLKLLSDYGKSRLGKMLDGKQIIGNNLKPYLRNSNVQWFSFKLDDLLEMDFDEKDKLEFSLKYGDILMCEGGEIGRCAIWKNQLQDCYFQKAIHRIRLNEEFVLPSYFVYMFRLFTSNGGLKMYMGAATISHLTGENLKKLKLPIPPIELQTQFAQIVEKTEALKAYYKSSLQELENLYGSLSQRAFRGELTINKAEEQVLMAAEPEAKYGKVIEFTPKKCDSTERAILAGHIINKTNKEDFGRVKFQKLLHLTTYHCKIDIDSNFTKKVAGPHDGDLLKDIESTLRRYRFYNINQSNKGNHKVNYTPLSSVSELEEIFDSNFESERERIDSFLAKFRKSSWEQCEIISTLYAVWNNRLLLNQEITDELLKIDFLDWDTQKVKYIGRLDDALQWMKIKGVIPDGWGKLIV